MKHCKRLKKKEEVKNYWLLRMIIAILLMILMIEN